MRGPDVDHAREQWQAVRDGFTAALGVLWFEDVGNMLRTHPCYLIEELPER